MPYVNVPNDLSKIKTKIAFNLTKRQLICFGIGAAVGIPTYLLTLFVKAFFNFYRLLQIDAKIFVETCEITSHVNKMHIFL